MASRKTGTTQKERALSDFKFFFLNSFNTRNSNLIFVVEVGRIYNLHEFHISSIQAQSYNLIS